MTCHAGLFSDLFVLSFFTKFKNTVQNIRINKEQIFEIWASKTYETYNNLASAGRNLLVHILKKKRVSTPFTADPPCRGPMLSNTGHPMLGPIIRKGDTMTETNTWTKPRHPPANKTTIIGLTGPC